MTPSATNLPDHLLRLPAGFLPELHIRLVCESDLPSLHAACFPDRPYPAFQRTMAAVLVRQEAGRSFSLLAEKTNPAQIVGSVQLHLHRRRGEIADLIVVARERKQGVGTALMDVVIRVGCYLDLDSLEVGVEENNLPAVRLYRRFNFVKDRSIKVPGLGRAIIMVLELRQTTGI